MFNTLELSGAREDLKKSAILTRESTVLSDNFKSLQSLLELYETFKIGKSWRLFIYIDCVNINFVFFQSPTNRTKKWCQIWLPLNWLTYKTKPSISKSAQKRRSKKWLTSKLRSCKRLSEFTIWRKTACKLRMKYMLSKRRVMRFVWKIPHSKTVKANFSNQNFLLQVIVNFFHS